MIYENTEKLCRALVAYFKNIRLHKDHLYKFECDFILNDDSCKFHSVNLENKTAKYNILTKMIIKLEPEYCEHSGIQLDNKK